MKCTYTYNDLKNVSYKELYQAILENAELDEDGILYSLQDDMVNKAKELKDKYLVEYIQEQYSDLNGEPQLKTPSGYTPLLNFIDSSLYTRQDGSPYIQQYSEEELQEAIRTKLKETGLNEEQIQEELDALKEKGEKTKEDSYLLHNAITSQWIFYQDDHVEKFVAEMQSK